MGEILFHFCFQKWNVKKPLFIGEQKHCSICSTFIGHNIGDKKFPLPLCTSFLSIYRVSEKSGTSGTFLGEADEYGKDPVPFFK